MINGFKQLDTDYNFVTKNESYKIFNDLKKRKVILNSSWSDSTWVLNDEVSNVSFKFNKFKSLKNYNCDDASYLYEQAKIFVCSLLGNYSLSSIQQALNDIAKILSKENIPCSANIFLLESFFSSIEGFDDCFDVIDEIQNKTFKNGKRDLASFETYFLFDELLTKYWENETDEKEKLFYAPIYFWWNICTIFPTRPTEFILTQRNCLEVTNGKFHLKLKKTKLKGGKTRVNYKINDDYDDYDCIIPDKLGKELQWYLKKTKSLSKTEINSLFSLETHYSKFNRNVGFKNRYLTRANFNTLFKSFYSEVIENKYHYKVIYDRSITHLNNGEIQMICMGDARHIALINIIAEGGTPLTAMRLAGHNNPSMSAHYFSNITTLIECKTYRLYRGQTEYKISQNIPVKIKDFIEIDGGRCYNENVVYRHNYNDCLNAVGKYGEIGFCKRCIYFKGEKIIDHKKELDQSAKHFLKLIEDYRKGKGSKDSILAELLSIQSKANSYQNFLLEEAKNGKKEIN